MSIYAETNYYHPTIIKNDRDLLPSEKADINEVYVLLHCLGFTQWLQFYVEKEQIFHFENNGSFHISELNAHDVLHDFLSENFGAYSSMTIRDYINDRYYFSPKMRQVLIQKIDSDLKDML